MYIWIKYVITDLGNGLTPVLWQAICWCNADPVKLYSTEVTQDYHVFFQEDVPDILVSKVATILVQHLNMD